MYLCVYMCVCVNTCICVNVYIFVCMCVNVYVCMCEWVHANAVGLDGNQKTMLRLWFFPSTSVCALGNPPQVSVKLGRQAP